MKFFLTLKLGEMVRSLVKMVARHGVVKHTGGLTIVALLAQGPVLAATLNDTGITTYGNDSFNALINEPAEYPGQDASYGRDAAARTGILTKVGDGNAGFDFSKIDAAGITLPADAATWSCVRDNVTGLVWEAKSDDGGQHDKDWTYTWYNSTGVNDGGSKGTTISSAICGGTVAAGCDTEKFAAAVNSSRLCGATGWRLPSRKELLTLVDNSRINPSIDTNYFPNTGALSNFWSSSPSSAYPSYAWHVHFNQGYVGISSKSDRLGVRLVHGGE